MQKGLRNDSMGWHKRHAKRLKYRKHIAGIHNIERGTIKSVSTHQAVKIADVIAKAKAEMKWYQKLAYRFMRMVRRIKYSIMPQWKLN